MIEEKKEKQQPGPEEHLVRRYPGCGVHCNGPVEYKLIDDLGSHIRTDGVVQANMGCVLANTQTIHTDQVSETCNTLSCYTH